MKNTMSPKARIRREVDTSPMSETEKKLAAQIAEYYRQVKLYAEGKLATEPKLPDSTAQKYKDLYDK